MSRTSLAVVIGLVFLSVIAIAETTAPQAPPSGQQPAASAGVGSQTLEKVTVTGYIIPRVGDGPQPVINLTRDFIEKQGDQTVSEVLQRLPQNTSSFTPAVNAGASFSPGASEVNLYGLGTNSTLVLINGRRQTFFPFPQNGFQSFVDLNSIPLAAVDRVEILKDSASATYGSDAIGGVVNIILKGDYAGGDISGYWGIAQRGDYDVYHVQATAGIAHQISENSKFGLLAAFDYYENSPIMQADRPNGTSVNYSKRGADLGDNRSSSTPAGNFTGLTTEANYSLNQGNTNPFPTPADFFIDPTGATFKNRYDTVPGAQLIPREQRYGAYLNASYQPFQYLKIYDEFLFERSQEKSSTTATPVTSSDFTPSLVPPGAAVIVPANNPFNPFGEALDPRLRLLEGGIRNAEVDIQNVRNVVGFTILNLPKNWFIDASFLYAESDGQNIRRNAFTRSGLAQALAGTLPGFEGHFFNPFVDASVPSAALTQNQRILDAIRVTTDDHARTGLTMWQLNGGGELFDVPAGPVTLGLGAEYRSDEYIDYKDKNSRIGNIIGPGAIANASGKDYVKSAYGELTIPILGGWWSAQGARVLEVVLAERVDDYSSFGEAWKPKISIRWKPFDDLTLRASYSEGFRAPSLTELFATPITGFQFLVDPVTGSTNQVAVVTIGNPRLQPETSYAYYAGFVWSPGSADPEHSWWGWANGFSCYVDWIEITKHNVIAQIDPQFILNHPDQFPPSQFVVRVPSANGIGQIAAVLDPLENLGAIRVDAFDFGASYSTKEHFWGELDLAVNASYQYHISEQNVPHGQVLNFADTFALPDFKLAAHAFYSKTVFASDKFQTGVTITFIDSEDDFQNFNTQGLTLQQFVAKTGRPDVHTVGNWTSFDWQISYEFGKPEEFTPETPRSGYGKDAKKILGENAISPVPEGKTGGWRRWLAGTKFTFGINNIFDTRAPFAEGPVPKGYDPQQGANQIGRFFYMALEKKF